MLFKLLLEGKELVGNRVERIPAWKPIGATRVKLSSRRIVTHGEVGGMLRGGIDGANDQCRESRVDGLLRPTLTLQKALQL